MTNKQIEVDLELNNVLKVRATAFILAFERHDIELFEAAVASDDEKICAIFTRLLYVAETEFAWIQKAQKERKILQRIFMYSYMVDARAKVRQHQKLLNLADANVNLVKSGEARYPASQPTTQDLMAKAKALVDGVEKL